MAKVRYFLLLYFDRKPAKILQRINWNCEAEMRWKHLTWKAKCKIIIHAKSFIRTHSCNSSSAITAPVLTLANDIICMSDNYTNVLSPPNVILHHFLKNTFSLREKTWYKIIMGLDYPTFMSFEMAPGWIYPIGGLRAKNEFTICALCVLLPLSTQKRYPFITVCYPRAPDSRC